MICALCDPEGRTLLTTEDELSTEEHVPLLGVLVVHVRSHEHFEWNLFQRLNQYSRTETNSLLGEDTHAEPITRSPHRIHFVPIFFRRTILVVRLDEEFVRADENSHRTTSVDMMQAVVLENRLSSSSHSDFEVVSEIVEKPGRRGQVSLLGVSESPDANTLTHVGITLHKILSDSHRLVARLCDKRLAGETDFCDRLLRLLALLCRSEVRKQCNEKH